MTRKDFKIIADILGAMESASVRDINFAIDKLAIAYPTFDRKKFVKYITKDKSPVAEKVAKPYICGGINNQIVLTGNPTGTRRSGYSHAEPISYSPPGGQAFFTLTDENGVERPISASVIDDVVRPEYGNNQQEPILFRYHGRGIPFEPVYDNEPRRSGYSHAEPIHFESQRDMTDHIRERENARAIATLIGESPNISERTIDGWT